MRSAFATAAIVTAISFSDPPARTRVAEACRQDFSGHAKTARIDANISISGAGMLELNEGRTQYIWTGTDCIAWIIVRGRIDVPLPADTLVLGPNAEFIVHEERANMVREFRKTPFAESLTIDGQAVTPGSDERVWLGDVVRTYVRRTGIGARARAAGILRDGGIRALLAEADLINGKNVRAAYLAEAFAFPMADSAKATFVREASYRLDRAHALSEFLNTAPASWRSNADVILAAYDAAASLDPDDARDAVLRAYPPPKPLPESLRGRLRNVIAGFRSAEDRKAWTARYLE